MAKGSAVTQVAVGCKLPHGIILEDPKNSEIKFKLNGPGASPIIGATHGTTRVDADLWDRWSKTNAKFPAVTSGAIFWTGSDSAEDVTAMAGDLSALKTGFERMQTDGKDPRAAGVKTEA